MVIRNVATGFPWHVATAAPWSGVWTFVRRRRLGVRQPCCRFHPGSHASGYHDGHQVLDIHRHRCFIPTMTRGTMFQWWRQGQQRHRPTPSMARLLKAGAWLPHTVRLRQTKSSGKKRPNSRPRHSRGHYLKGRFALPCALTHRGQSPPQSAPDARFQARAAMHLYSARTQG